MLMSQKYERKASNINKFIGKHWERRCSLHKAGVLYEWKEISL